MRCKKAGTPQGFSAVEVEGPSSPPQTCLHCTRWIVCMAEHGSRLVGPPASACPLVHNEMLLCLSVTQALIFLACLPHSAPYEIASPMNFGGLGARLVSDNPSQETAKNCSSKASVVTGIAVSCFTTLCFRFKTMPVLWLLAMAQHKYRWTFLHMGVCACMRVVWFVSGSEM